MYHRLSYVSRGCLAPPPPPPSLYYICTGQGILRTWYHWFRVWFLNQGLNGHILGITMPLPNKEVAYVLNYENSAEIRKSQIWSASYLVYPIVTKFPEWWDRGTGTENMVRCLDGFSKRRQKCSPVPRTGTWALLHIPTFPVTMVYQHVESLWSECGPSRRSGYPKADMEMSCWPSNCQ